MTTKYAEQFNFINCVLHNCLTIMNVNIVDTKSIVISTMVTKLKNNTIPKDRKICYHGSLIKCRVA